MALFQSARQFVKPHAHLDEDRCPWCEQPISRDKFEEIRRRMTAEERQRLADMAERFARERAEAEARAREEGKQAAEAANQARLAELEQGNKAAAQQLQVMREAQEAVLNQKLQEVREAMQKDKVATVQAVQIHTFEERQKLQEKVLDLQRQLERKSAHELGEGAEIDLFEQLKSAFENDRIRRVGKGVNGADVIHEIVHNGKVCGKIIYDAKNRNAWQNEFVNKLRADKLAEGADHAILSSNKFPKDRREIHLQEGVIVASPARVLTLVELLRGLTVRMHELRVSEEAREQKSAQLYAFITSEHCRQLLDSVQIQTSRMLDLDAREQEAHRRTWDQRGKLIKSVQKVRSDLTFEIDRVLGTAAEVEREP